MVRTRNSSGNGMATVQRQQEKKTTRSKSVSIVLVKRNLRKSPRVTNHENNSNDSLSFGRKATLRRSIREDPVDSDSGSNELRCKKCNQTFTRKQHLRRHVQYAACLTTEEKQVYKCTHCFRYYSRPDNLRQHMRLHEDELNESASSSSASNSPACQSAPETSVNPVKPGEGLSENQPAERKRSYVHTCSQCNKSFYAASLLKLHMRRHTGERPYPCDSCDKKFSTSSALKKHSRTHTGDRPYKCDHCPGQFATRATLNRHLRVHAGIRPYVCQYCGKGFGQSGGLKAHLFFHTGENGFECEVCGRKFNRKERLKTHIKFVHEQDKPFDCDKCYKKFVRKEDLARHLLIHTGQRPHACSICTARFSLKFSVNLHMLTHEASVPHFCDVCNVQFKRKDCLLRHQRKWHRPAATSTSHNKSATGTTNNQVNPAEPDRTDLGDEPLAELIHLFDFDNLTREIQNNKLEDAVVAFLCKLIDEETRRKIGWPEIEAQPMLDAVIRLCGQQPIPPSDSVSSNDLLRENVKLLFREVEDPTISSFLGIKTVDEIVLYLIQMLD